MMFKNKTLNNLLEILFKYVMKIINNINVNSMSDNNSYNHYNK